MGCASKPVEVDRKTDQLRECVLRKDFLCDCTENFKYSSFLKK